MSKVFDSPEPDSELIRIRPVQYPSGSDLIRIYYTEFWSNKSC